MKGDIRGSAVADRTQAMYLVAEVRFFQAVSIHDFNQIFQHAVKNLVQLFPDDGQRLLGWQHSCVEFHLQQQKVPLKEN